jgi:L-cysteine desulfidase
MNQNAFIQILEREMVPALGCTDPAGLAYAAAYARKHARGELKSITGELSANIIKNAAAVCIPEQEENAELLWPAPSERSAEMRRKGWRFFQTCPVRM